MLEAERTGVERDQTMKVLVVGDIGTGKTAFIHRYIHRLFSIHYKSTIGADFAQKIVKWDDNLTIRLQLWDIAGQERFGTMTRVYYRDAVGAFVLFDVTRASTFEAVERWKNDLDSKAFMPNGCLLPIVLVANKCDQESLFEKAKIDKFCTDQGFVGWLQTSAKENTGIEKAVHFLLDKILEYDECETDQDPDRVQLKQVPHLESNSCCSCKHEQVQRRGKGFKINEAMERGWWRHRLAGWLTRLKFHLKKSSSI